MENKKTEFVTHLEMELAQSRLRSDMKREIRQVEDNLDSKIDITNGKVDALSQTVLPMVESSKQTAENTKKTAELMERFTDDQRRTNGKFYDKLHQHDLQFSGIEGQFVDVGVRLDARTESKKHNATLWAALIGLMGIIISGIFAAAPSFFN